MKKPFKPDILKKAWLKLTNKKAFLQYKREHNAFKMTRLLRAFVEQNKPLTIEGILKTTESKKEINLIHSGNAGDIIYALPVVKELYKLTAKPLNLLFRLNEAHGLDKSFSHPLGTVMMNEQMATKLAPLVKQQAYINDCRAFVNERTDISLDSFRDAGFYLDRGNITRWNIHTTGITANLSDAWLHVEPDVTYADTIVVARSSRYNNPLIDHSFLSQYKNLAFLGIETEFEAMREMVPHIKWAQVVDFLQMARIIAGCNIFIGNQSFPYAVAEALKVPRILEVYYASPNVMPEGKNGHDFIFQEHFEYLVKTLYHPKAL